MMRVDHNRAAAAGGQGRRRRRRGDEHHDLGHHSASSTPISSTRRSAAQCRRARRRPGLARERVHSRGAEARRGDHRGACSSSAAFGGQRGDRSRARLVGGPRRRMVSMAVPSDGSYGLPEGIICGVPVRTATAPTRWSRACRSASSRARDRCSRCRLVEERDAVANWAASVAASGGGRQRARARCRPPPAAGLLSPWRASLVALDDLASFSRPGKDPVEVVLLDPHLRRDLGDRDPRLSPLTSSRVWSARVPEPRRAAANGRRWRACASVLLRAPGYARRGRAPRASHPEAGERRGRRLELAVLVDGGSSSRSRAAISPRFACRKSLTDIPLSSHRSLTVQQIAVNT